MFTDRIQCAVLLAAELCKYQGQARVIFAVPRATKKSIIIQINGEEKQKEQDGDRYLFYIDDIILFPFMYFRFFVSITNNNREMYLLGLRDS